MHHPGAVLIGVAQRDLVAAVAIQVAERGWRDTPRGSAGRSEAAGSHARVRLLQARVTGARPR
jgi:hypothetical protein